MTGGYPLFLDIANRHLNVRYYWIPGLQILAYTVVLLTKGDLLDLGLQTVGRQRLPGPLQELAKSGKGGENLTALCRAESHKLFYKADSAPVLAQASNLQAGVQAEGLLATTHWKY